MGTFLRTWRAEWAGMSRRQLATVVSGLLNSKKTVSPTIIREWEDGQPPKTTDELEALCQVMGRNRMSGREVGAFRRTVFAACGARQYPGLFAEGVAEDPQVEAWACAAMQREGADPGSSEVIGLVAHIAEVWKAIRSRARPSTGRKRPRLST